MSAAPGKPPVAPRPAAPEAIPALPADRYVRARPARVNPARRLLRFLADLLHPRLRFVPPSALPGGLDATRMLNSNFPERLRGPGIALSTFPWPGSAHLGRAFEGSFKIFAHHNNASGRTLYQTVALFNPGPGPVTLVRGAASSHTTTDAPYRDNQAAVADDPPGRRVSGPGDATASAILRCEGAGEPLVLPPGKVTVLHVKDVPAGDEVTSMFELEASGPVHAAVVFSDTAAGFRDTLARGGLLLRNQDDKPPTPPGQPGAFVYGRVAGVQDGATWRATAPLAIGPEPFAASFVLVGKRTNSLGTGQDQAASLSARYPDAAFAAHGSYGVTYDLKFPVANKSADRRTVRLWFDTPTPAPGLSRAFRGTVAIDVAGQPTRYVHVHQKAGEAGRKPLATLDLPPGQSRDIRVRLVYPADATPPHALRFEA